MQHLSVQPAQFRGIEHRAAASHTIERERLQQVVARQDLAIVAGMKSQQREIAEQCIGDEAGLAPIADRTVDDALAPLSVHEREQFSEWMLGVKRQLQAVLELELAAAAVPVKELAP